MFQLAGYGIAPNALASCKAADGESGHSSDDDI